MPARQADSGSRTGYVGGSTDITVTVQIEERLVSRPKRLELSRCLNGDVL